MDLDKPERPTIENFIGDLEGELRRIDDHIFRLNGYSPGTILTFAEFPQDDARDTRVSSIASFLVMVPRTEKSMENIAIFPKNHECYVLWQTGIERKIESLSRDVNYAGMGDHGIKTFWFLTAVALVRRRVLFRPEWFAKAAKRTIASMTKHIDVFGDEGFAKLRELSRRKDDPKRTPLELDMQLTQLLVTAALENGTSPHEALDYLITD